MFEDDISQSHRILLNLHNQCIVRPETAKTGAQIAQAVRLSICETFKILHNYEAEGYVRRLVNQEGTKFYLTGYGILNVCALFT